MKIAVWNTAFLGDTILTLPLLLGLRKVYPDATIDFWVRSSYSELYASQTAYTVHSYRKATDGTLSGLYALGEKIYRKPYDIWINPHPSYRSAYIAYASKAPMRISYTKPCVANWFSTHSVERNLKVHEVYRLLELGKVVGVPQEMAFPYYIVPLNTQKEVQEYWDSVGVITGETKVLTLAIGALWNTKQWLPEYFGTITKWALKKGFHVAFVGAGANERALLYRIVEYAGCSLEDEKIHNFIDASLTYTAQVLATSTVCCGNDTGLMHLAWIQEIPTVALFGATASAQGFYPLGEHSISLEATLSCRPCGNHGAQQCPKKHFLCMKNLSPEIVWNAIEGRMQL